MVLVDTCIWIFGFAGRQPYDNTLRDLLRRDRVAGHNLIYGELLMGDNGGRKKLLANYRLLEHLATVAHGEVTILVEARKLHGRGLSWIDAHLLASTLVSRAKLWTADDLLAEAAGDLGIAYRP